MVSVSTIQSFVKASGVKSILQTKESIFQRINPKELKYAPLEIFTTKISKKVKLSESTLSYLRLLQKNNPEKYKIINSSEYLQMYAETSAKEYQLNYFRSKNLLVEGDINIAKKMDSTAKELTNIFDAKRIVPNNDMVRSLIEFNIHNPKAYKYVLDSNELTNFFRTGRSYRVTKNLDIGELKAIEKALKSSDINNKIISDYVKSSDSFNQDVKKVKELNSILKTSKLDEKITAYRAERGCNIFDDIKIKDTILEQKLKGLLNKNSVNIEGKFILNKDCIYDTFSLETKNILEYFKTKQEYSLSDAMLLAKYGDDSFTQELCKTIENVVISDQRFKSTSFSEAFVDTWLKKARGANSENSMPFIKSKLKINKGNEGKYIVNHSDQHEFLLNNNNKKIQYSNIKYDKNNNIFYMDGEIVAI